MKVKILLVFMFGLCLFATAAEYEQVYKTKAVVKEVYDGDTIIVAVTKEYRIRMLDCWAPEVKTKDKEEKARGIASRDYLRSILKDGDEILVEVPMTDRFEDSITLGRVLARVYKDLDGDGKPDNISEEMVRNEFATKEKVKNGLRNSSREHILMKRK